MNRHSSDDQKTISAAEATGEQGGRTNIWFFISIAALVLLAGMTVLVVLLMSGKIRHTASPRDATSAQQGEAEVTPYSDIVSMELMIRRLDSASVCICGNCIVSDESAVSREGDVWMINGIPEDRGMLDTLTLFGEKKITELSLINQTLSRLNGLADLQTLEYLDLSGALAEDLSPVASLKNLEVLRIEKLPLSTDLSPLAKAPALKQVYVSYDMVKNIRPLLDADIEVIVTKE